MSLINRIILSYNLRKKRQKFIKEFNRCNRMCPNTKLVVQGTFVYGKNITIYDEGIDNYLRSQIVVLTDACLSIGDNSGLSQVSIICKEKIAIGANVKIGAGTMIFDTNFHNTDWQVRRDANKDLVTAKTKPVFIGDDCFVGARCIICKGVSIGARSIIAAGSVVIHDIPEDSIAGGNPCVVIKKLH